MLSFEGMKKKNSNVGTIGQQLKKSSDMVMQNTFDNDVQTKIGYLYDYYHDDQAGSRSGYNPSLSKTKIPVKLKFIVKSYKTIAKDEPDYHIQFSPDDWNNQTFKPDWFNKYQRLDIEFPVGLYVDIENDRGVYEKWLICYNESSNQFPKFGVIKCNYKFTWITDNGVNRYQRRVWGVERIQNSYTSGIWDGDKTTAYDDQGKFFVPWFPITSELKHDMRLFISILQKESYVYTITKIKNTAPKGIVSVTVKQDTFNEHTDYVNLETGDMFADYYKKSIIPVEEEILKEDTAILPDGYINLKCTVAQVKVNGGYKTITATCFDNADVDITSKSTFNWEYIHNNADASGLVDVIVVEPNKIKVKFIGDENYLGEILTVKCKTGTISQELQLNIVAL